MPRRIVICIDGTNNAPGAGLTNVQRMHRMLARNDDQVLYYQPGVGTVEPGSLTTQWARRSLMLVDSMSAIMLRRHVCAAYRFLMAEYRDDDTLYGFGFSRGAYAIRVLFGMLRKVGLLHRGQDEMVDFAWRLYAAHDNREQASEFRNAYSRFIPMFRFLGLFDTVSAVGTPWRPRVFDYTFGNDRVQTVRHALALDEHRALFVQNLWRAADEVPPEVKRHTDVRQVWFAGVHADVGGGYPAEESGLSRVPLAWMRDHAQEAGLVFRPRVSVEQLTGLQAPAQTGAEKADTVSVVAANLEAPAHDELTRRRFWQLLEWIPIPRWRPNGNGDWVRRWRCHRGRARTVPPASLLHFSVAMRRERTGYLPRPELENPAQDSPPTGAPS